MVVPAAGPGRRLGGGPKALVRLAGRALLAHAVEAVEANASTVAVVVVGHPDALDATGKLLADEGLAKVTAVVAGGPTRQASVAAGLRALPPGPGYVAVHDAARPLVAHGAVDRMLALLLEAGVAGVVPGVPVIDTIRRVDAAQRSTGIVDRDQLRAMQTPSCSSARCWRRRTGSPAATGSRRPTRPPWSSWPATGSRSCPAIPRT